MSINFVGIHITKSPPQIENKRHYDMADAYPGRDAVFFNLPLYRFPRLVSLVDLRTHASESRGRVRKRRDAGTRPLRHDSADETFC